MEKEHGLKGTLFRPLFLQFLFLTILMVALPYFLSGKERPLSFAAVPHLFVQPAVSASLDPVAQFTADDQSFKQQILQEKKRKPAAILSASEKMAKRVSRSMVTVVSPLGKATGFFIDWKGHILTSGSVIKLTEAELENVRNQKLLLEQIITLEQKHLQTIRQKMSLLTPGYGKERLQKLSEEKKEELHKNFGAKREIERLLANSGGKNRDDLAGVHVFWGGEKQLELKSVAVSSTRNLALLQVKTAAVKYRPLRPRTIPLKVGDRVYAAGFGGQASSPVEEGRVSAFQENDGWQRICSDIRIRKEDSGGPLLDSYGNVSGMNILPFQGGGGKGCAIPISAAYGEFSSSLTPQIRPLRYKKIIGGAKP